MRPVRYEALKKFSQRQGEEPRKRSAEVQPQEVQPAVVRRALDHSADRQFVVVCILDEEADGFRRLKIPAELFNEAQCRVLTEHLGAYLPDFVSPECDDSAEIVEPLAPPIMPSSNEKDPTGVLEFIVRVDAAFFKIPKKERGSRGIRVGGEAGAPEYVVNCVVDCGQCLMPGEVCVCDPIFTMFA